MVLFFYNILFLVASLVSPDMSDYVKADSDTVVSAAAAVRDSGRVVFAFRSNMLLPAMNVGFEVPLGRRWSVEGDWYYTWGWPQFFDNSLCAELHVADIGFRLWFPTGRSERLTGHSLALVAAGAYYDFGHDYKTSTGAFDRMKGQQGEALGLSLDWTYAWRVGRNAHMEVGVAAGVAYHRYIEYMQYKKWGPLLRDPMLIVHRGWFYGPTSAHLSLVVPIRSRR